MSLRPPTPPPRRTLSRQGSSGSTRGSSFGGGDDDDEGDGTSGRLGLMEGASERLRAAVRFVWERGAAEAEKYAAGRQLREAVDFVKALPGEIAEQAAAAKAGVSPAGSQAGCHSMRVLRHNRACG